MISIAKTCNTIPSVLVQAAKQRPQNIAVHEQDKTWTNSELLEEVKLVAKSFIACGLKAKDTFAIWAPNRVEWIITALAGQMAGGVLVPLNTRYKGGEAADIIRRSRAKFLFTVDVFLETNYVQMLKHEELQNLKSTILFPDKNLADWKNFCSRSITVSDDVLDERFSCVDENSLCDILFTSGTTGQPKGVMTCHGQNIAIYTEWANAVGIEQGDVYLIANPFFHAFGYKAGWLAALIGGAKILPLDVFDVEIVLKLIESESVTVLPGPPTVFQTLINHPRLNDFDLKSLKRTITGAASVPVQLVRNMKSVLGFDTVLTGYGLTEATGTVSLSRKGDDFETIANFSGRPLEGIEVKIVNAEGESLDNGEQGEIWVRGYNVMQGYLDDRAATNETITPDGWLKTGDIGFQNSDGYLKITDRAKDMFITGGFNCYPAEIENILLQHDDIVDVAVVGDSDERLGEVCHAHLVMKDGFSSTKKSIIAWARENMANFKVPRKVSFHQSLPRNAGGKVQKFLL